jgi:hypothetical protein
MTVSRGEALGKERPTNRGRRGIEGEPREQTVFYSRGAEKAKQLPEELLHTVLFIREHLTQCSNDMGTIGQQQ